MCVCAFYTCFLRASIARAWESDGFVGSRLFVPKRNPLSKSDAVDAEQLSYPDTWKDIGVSPSVKCRPVKAVTMNLVCNVYTVWVGLV